MTGSNNNAFTVTIKKNGVTLNTFRRHVDYKENAKKWGNFRISLNSVRDEVNSFLTQEVESKKYTLIWDFYWGYVCFRTRPRE